MCQLCVDAIKTHLPDLPEDEWFKYLIDFTCFPFGTGEEVAEQIKDLVDEQNAPR